MHGWLVARHNLRDMPPQQTRSAAIALPLDLKHPASRSAIDRPRKAAMRDPRSDPNALKNKVSDVAHFQIAQKLWNGQIAQNAQLMPFKKIDHDRAVQLDRVLGKPEVNIHVPDK